ncbi:AraC family transcriptional regulator [Desulfovibrio inopinatus]|uniref:AraC family transcriptional regulator n=1 Tax=Desulfovibrio inopinatus TaxID=102109 RepID=UPI0004221AA6|nr:AraC family transcriptional regulator [Desulfovibrio inopinatus]
MKLSIRTFSSASFCHTHPYHQLVIALQGGADNFTDNGDGRIGPGQCIVFPAGCLHQCIPDEQSRFLVVDLEELPKTLQNLPSLIVSVPVPLQMYCHFVEKQLEDRLNPVLEHSIGELFEQLLHHAIFLPNIDFRIAKVIEHFEKNISSSTSVAELASISALSLSQFKKLFKEQTGKTPGQFLQQLRMEKARALLAHTDYPLSIIAEMVGYSDVSSFSRRFSFYFGHSPRNSRKQ